MESKKSVKITKKKSKIEKKDSNNGDVRMLIVITAGDNSCHEMWEYNKNNIDICVIYYGSDKSISKKYKKNSNYFMENKGAKWELIYMLINKKNIDFNEYDFIWFPDDDLSIKDNVIEKMLYYANKYELFLSQPSLEDNGNITNVYKNILRHENNQSILKYTNFVEIMCPLMSIRCFNLIKYTLMSDDIKCGWGLDDVWGDIIIKQYKYHNKIAIINDIYVTHTKPPSKPYEGFYNLLSIDPIKEMEKTLLKYNVKRVDKIIFNRF